MDYDRHIRNDSVRFGDVLSAADPTAVVPSCPGWDAAELAWHLTEVQLFWASIVERRLDEPSPAESMKPARPHAYRDLLELLEKASSRLSAALAASSDETPVWTWSSDRTVGFIRRRQAHEALIHRVDAELTAGVTSFVDPHLAADGVDELLTVFVGGVPEWAAFTPNGARLQIDTTDTRRTWHLEMGAMRGTSPTTGTTYDLPAVNVVGDALPPDALVAGPAAGIDLWLWGRATLDGLTVTGDVELVESLRRLVADDTQ